MKKKFNIELYIKNKNEMFERWNIGKLSDEIGHYLDREIKYAPVNTEVFLNIHHDNIELNESDKEEIIDLIHDYYSVQSKYQIRYDRYTELKQATFFLIGVVLILISSYLSEIFTFLIPELFLIAGWVAIWETVYSVWFTEKQTRLKIKRSCQLSNCNINFYNNF